MKETFDLNKMGLAPMTGEEMQEIDGGDWPLDVAVVFGVLKGIFTHYILFK